MSSTITLDIIIDSNTKVSSVCIIEKLIANGWDIMKDGEAKYLPIDDNDMYFWMKEKMLCEDVYKLLEAKEKKGQNIGLELFWQNTSLGITLLVFKPNELTFNLDINTKYLNSRMVDFNWYFENIVLYLQKDYHILKYSFSVLY